MNHQKILHNLDIDPGAFKKLPITEVRKVIQTILPVSREDI